MCADSCSLIVVVANGRVSELGTHEELIAANGECPLKLYNACMTPPLCLPSLPVSLLAALPATVFASLRAPLPVLLPAQPIAHARFLHKHVSDQPSLTHHRSESQLLPPTCLLCHSAAQGCTPASFCCRCSTRCRQQITCLPHLRRKRRW